MAEVRKFKLGAAADRLYSLGITAELLVDAVSDGQIARDTCTANDPATLAGLLAWGRTVRGLRERLIPLGWTRGNSRGLETAIHPSGEFAIAVATGDEATGIEAQSPKSRHPKGSSMASAVNRNQKLLWEDVIEREVAIAPATNCETWVLLICVCESEVRSELALPVSIGIDGRVEEWRERIILPALALDETRLPIAAFEEPEEIVVEVIRKAE